jgi:hypothetical protein
MTTPSFIQGIPLGETESQGLAAGKKPDIFKIGLDTPAKCECPILGQLSAKSFLNSSVKTGTTLKRSSTIP